MIGFFDFPQPGAEPAPVRPASGRKSSFDPSQSSVRYKRDQSGGHRSGQNLHRIHRCHAAKNKYTQPAAADGRRDGRRADGGHGGHANPGQNRAGRQRQFHFAQDLRRRSSPSPPPIRVPPHPRPKSRPTYCAGSAAARKPPARPSRCAARSRRSAESESETRTAPGSAWSAKCSRLRAPAAAIAARRVSRIAERHADRDGDRHCGQHQHQML